MRDKTGHYHRDPRKPRKPRRATKPRRSYEIGDFADMSSRIHSRGAVRLTATQRNSEGRRSEWNASPYRSNPVEHDTRWSVTVSN